MEIKFEGISYLVDDKKVIDNLNLKFKAGKINALLGPTGSGKSALIKMLNGITKPSTGIITIGTKKIEVEKLSNDDINDIKFNVGIVQQFPEDQLFGETVAREIAYGLELFNYKKNSIDKRVKDAIKMVGLPETILKRDPLTLSIGEMRRVSLASVLAVNPEVIVLDEPTLGLDSDGRRNLIRVLSTIKRRYGKTIIIASQDIEFVHQCSDYIFLLNKGKIVHEGNKYDFFKTLDLKNSGIAVPRVMAFAMLVAATKKIKLGYRDDINDLLKDIMRNIK